MGNKLYVGNLSYNTTQADLSELFSQSGKVQEAAIIMDRETNTSKGFAFVTMSTDEEAQKAIADFNGKMVDNRALKVNEARPREERGGNGGGFRGGRR